MKNEIIALSLFFCFFFMYNAGMARDYQSGAITFPNDPGFGKNTDWEDPSFYKLSAITVANDGSVFAAVSNQHKVIKLDSNGNHLLEFGQKGRGPGDMVNISGLSILDDRYLLVCEYATNRRINLFSLDGKFNRLIKTDYPVHEAIPLKSNKIAILSISHPGQARKFSVYIKDLNSGADNLITTGSDNMLKIKTPGFTLRSSFQKKCFICRTMKGNLLVGFNDHTKISIYSPGGKKIRSFELDLKPVAVTRSIAAKIQGDYVKYLEDLSRPQRYIKKIRRLNSFEKLFKKHLPLYSAILVDDEGNILVFYYSGYERIKKHPFQVYTPDGKYIGKSMLDFGRYGHNLINERFTKFMVFFKNHLYGLLDLDNGTDICRYIVKVNIK